MSFEPVTLPVTYDDFAERDLKRAREQLCRQAQENRVTWKQVEEMAIERFGKSKGLTIGECKKLIEEVKRRRR